jgi:T5SS/PEP-CTERM-associated repeat protein
MGDVYNFVVTSPAAAFNSAGSWQDLTNPGNFGVPGPNNAAQFINNTATVTGTGMVLSLLFQPFSGTQQTIWTASVTAGSAYVALSATLKVQGGISNFGTIYDAGSIVVQPAAAAPAFKPLVIGGGGGGGGGPELDFSQLTITGSYVVGAGGRSVGSGTVYLAGVLGVSGTLDIGTNSLLTGSLAFPGATPPSTITVSGGGLLNDGYAVLGGAAGTTDTATVSGAGSRWTTARGLIIGLNGTGSMTVTSGAIVSDAYTNIGNGPGAGSVILQGGTLSETGNLSVGAKGTGTLDVAAGSTLTDGGDLYIGFSGNPPGTGTSTGAVTIEGGSTATVSGPHGIDLGELQGDAGSLTVTGSGTKLTVNPGGIVVGYYGTGTLDIAAMAVVTAAFLNVGTTVGSPASDTATIESGASLQTGSGAVGGFVVIDDADWTVTGGLTVGGLSTASQVTVQNGGTLSTAGGTIGPAGGATPRVGTVLVDNASWLSSGAVIVGDGAAANLNLSNDASFSATVLTIGNSAAGQFSVDSGALASIAALTVAAMAGSAGTIAVDAGTIDITGDATVGGGGAGTLAVSDAGTVTVGGMLTADTGIVTVTGASSLLGVTGNLVIGNTATGTVSLAVSAALTAGGALILGDAATGNGRLTTSDLATFRVGSAQIGEGGTGTLDLHSYSAGTISGAAVIGDVADAVGTVAIDSNASLLAGAMTIGNAGTGEVDVTDFGVLTVTNQLTVAATGTGLLRVNSATANLGSVVIGDDPLAAGTIDAQASAIVIDSGSFALNDGGLLSLEGGSVSAASFTIDSTSQISGYGVVSGPFASTAQIYANAGRIIASGGGTLRVIGNIGGAGLEEIGGGSTLSLQGVLANTGTIDFLGAGTLILAQPGSTVSNVTNFGQGDTIDFAGTIFAGITYDPLGNRILLTNSSNTVVETVQLVGDSSAKAFFLTPDGAGGSDVAAASNRPTAAVLGDLAADTYNQTPSTSLDGFSAFASSSGAGFLAVAYKDGNGNIVIAYRGTVPTEYKNLLSDTSFVTGIPSAAFTSYTSYAAAFLAKIAAANPGANITVTGHSLGGALAQLVGLASGLDTVTFDAPGPLLLILGLRGALAPASALNTSHQTPTITNYRLYGDQVSEVGVQVGLTVTEPSPYPRNWLTALDNHGTAPLIAAIRKAPAQAVLGTPDPPLASLEAPNPGIGSIIHNGVEVGVYAVNVNFKTDLAIDPMGPEQFSLDDLPGSVGMASIGLPDIPAVGDTPAVAEWLLDILNGDSIVQTMTVAPDTTVTPGFDFSGADFTPLDADGNVVDVPPFVFTLGFDQSGTFETQLDEQCYAAGTAIATTRGKVPVERLRRGDIVLLADGGRMPVRALPRQRIDLRRHLQPEMVRPVRIRAGAIGTGVPVRDLVVSPDHAVLVDGALIQARRLINRATIVQDDSADSVTYHHVLLGRHALLLAEGLPAESFLPTAHRGRGMRLATDTNAVERIWRRLAARAEALGVASREPAWIADPALRLVADGRIILPKAAGPAGTLFITPPGAATVRLVSRCARPTDRQPWLDDRRVLGVQIAALTQHGAGGRRTIPLDDTGFGDGWHKAERIGRGPRRWTNGDALLALHPGTEVIELTVSGRVAYPDHPM